MRTTLHIDDKILEKAFELTGVKEKVIAQLPLDFWFILANTKNMNKLSDLSQLTEQQKDLFIIELGEALERAREENSKLKEENT